MDARIYLYLYCAMTVHMYGKWKKFAERRVKSRKETKPEKRRQKKKIKTFPSMEKCTLKTDACVLNNKPMLKKEELKKKVG